MNVHRPSPDRMYVRVPEANETVCKNLAVHAVAVAQKNSPKLSGASSRSLEPIWGVGWFGVRWDPSTALWYQERGTRPHTMRSLAGKTVPMWIDDPTGKERAKNPKAKIRTTASGKVQVLIFRKAAKLGQRVRRRRNGAMVEVPASYPGAPGRIVNRDAAAPWTARGRKGGQIRPGNVGVRWRHPGIERRGFVRFAIQSALDAAGYPQGQIATATRSQPWMTRA